MDLRIVSVFVALLMILPLACGCSSSTISPDTLAIEIDGEDITTFSLVKGDDPPILTADITPVDYSGEILWESSDAGVIRVQSTDDKTCTLSILKSGTAKITVTCGSKQATVKITVEKNQSQLSEAETAYYINGTQYSAEMLNLYFVDAYELFLEEYGDYASYYGLDTSTGLSGLADQSCDYSSDGTWRGFFLESACSNLLYTVALCDWAEENDCTLSEEETARIQEQILTLEGTASESGYSSSDEYLKDLYGTGVDTEMYEEFLTQVALADSAYAAYSNSLSYTDSELEEHCTELGYDSEDYEYPTVSMRHILILAEPDEDGTYSEEAISTAHEKASEIYNEWVNGTATEETFAELASQYSEDTASVSDGGLYENVYQEEMVDGINEWLFSSDRKTGDATVIDNNGTYVGSHVVLYCGTDEEYGIYLAECDLINTDISDWMDSLISSYSCEEGTDYDSAGNITFG